MKESVDADLKKIETEFRHKLVIAEYFKNGFKKAEAYMSQYPDSAYKSAASAFSRLIKNDKLKADFESRMAQHAEAEGLTPAYVVANLKSMVDGNIKDMVDSEGRMLPPHKLPDHIASRVCSVKTEQSFDEDGNVVTNYEYKLENKPRCLELLGKTQSLFTDKVEHGGNVQVDFNMDFGGNDADI